MKAAVPLAATLLALWVSGQAGNAWDAKPTNPGVNGANGAAHPYPAPPPPSIPPPVAAREISAPQRLVEQPMFADPMSSFGAGMLRARPPRTKKSQSMLYVAVGNSGGRDSRLPAIRQRVEALGLQAHVRLEVARPHAEIPIWMAAADLFCLEPS